MRRHSCSQTVGSANGSSAGLGAANHAAGISRQGQANQFGRLHQQQKFNQD